jgi:tetratricopeptide (TPR) repeat protein
LNNSGKVIRQLLKYDNQLSEAYFVRGGYYDQKDSIVKALEEYDKAIRYNSNYFEAYVAKGSRDEELDLAISFARGAILRQEKGRFSVLKGNGPITDCSSIGEVVLFPSIKTGDPLFRKGADDRVDELGYIHDVCGCPNFDRSYFSPEAQAFYLLMEAAANDYAGK